MYRIQTPFLTLALDRVAAIWMIAGCAIFGVAQF
jgi:hypothetical protein